MNSRYTECFFRSHCFFKIIPKNVSSKKWKKEYCMVFATRNTRRGGREIRMESIGMGT